MDQMCFLFLEIGNAMLKLWLKVRSANLARNLIQVNVVGPLSIACDNYQPKKRNKMIKKILKGILLWVTMVTIVLFVSGIDSIIEHSFSTFLAGTALCMSLTNLCYNTLTFNEFYTLSGAKLFDKIIK